jgi:acetolactate synthase small subunit
MKIGSYVLTIKADDRPGLLHLITGIINRRLIEIESLSAAKTDIQTIVLITIELNISEKALTQLVLKLQNIVEVFNVDAVKMTQAACLRAACFRMDKAFLKTPEKAALLKYSAAIVNIYNDSVLITKFGSEAAIRDLFNQLDGPHLMGFSQTGLIADSKLIIHEDIERISGLAA